MNVRVCGPNLRDQSRGYFHVHADGCRDLRKYGPQYHGMDGYGGDLNGNREMLVKDATVMAVVLEVCADQIAESEDSWEDYVHEFWFAPCCVNDLEYHAVAKPKLPLFDSGDPSLGDEISDEFGSGDHIMGGPMFEVVKEIVYDGDTDQLIVDTDVYECWIADKKGTFKQVYSREELNAWLDENFDSLEMHERISIVRHHLGEYQS